MTTQLLPKRSGLWKNILWLVLFARLDFEWIDYGSRSSPFLKMRIK